MVEIFTDRLEITNPGGLVKGLTPETFGKISMLRNPGIANLFHRIDYIEKMGTGIERIRLALEEADVPTVQYELNPVYVKAVFQRQGKGWKKTGEKTGEKIKLGNNEKRVLDLIKNNPDITISVLAEKLDIGLTTVENNLGKLKKKRLIKRVGPDRWYH